MANTKTIGTGQDYTTIASWEDYMDGLIGGDDQTGQLTGLAEDNADVIIGGWSDTGNTVRLECQSGEEPDGTDNHGARYDCGIFMSEVDESHIEIYGIEGHTGTTDNVMLKDTMDDASTVLTVTKCLFRDAAQGIQVTGNTNDHEVNVGVCLFRQLSSTGVYLYDSSMTDVQVQNCTFYDTRRGIRERDGTYADCRNNAVCNYDVDNADEDYVDTPSNMANCFSSGDGTGNVDTLRNDGTDFTNAGADDFNLTDTNSVLYHAGSVPGGGWPAWMPATDLVGTAYHATTPSVGCFEYVVAGGVAPTGALYGPLVGPMGGPI